MASIQTKFNYAWVRAYGPFPSASATDAGSSFACYPG